MKAFGHKGSHRMFPMWLKGPFSDEINTVWAFPLPSGKSNYSSYSLIWHIFQGKQKSGKAKNVFKHVKYCCDIYKFNILRLKLALFISTNNSKDRLCSEKASVDKVNGSYWNFFTNFFHYCNYNSAIIMNYLCVNWAWPVCLCQSQEMLLREYFKEFLTHLGKNPKLTYSSKEISHLGN